MAGTVVTTQKRQSSIKSAVIDWTSSAGGAADGAFDMDGVIQTIVTNPGAGPPTASYDIVLNDADGIDLAMGLLANRSSTATEGVCPLLNSQRVAYAGSVTVAVSAAGSATQGRITVNYR